MKKLKRLIEVKRQLGLAEQKMERAATKKSNLVKERSKLLSSFTDDEKRLYKEQIERACR